MPETAEKKSKFPESRPQNIVTGVSLDKWTHDMLLERSGGRISSYVRQLLAVEYGRHLEQKRREELEKSRAKKETLTEA
jgi:hypothetical protein